MDKNLIGAVSIFARRCDELTESNFILADKKISEVLKSIAASDFLYKLVHNCLDGFDYQSFKENAFVKKDTGGERDYKVALPEEPDKLIAFVFCLLMDFDNKALDLHKFLQTFFFEDGSYFESFSSFCSAVIVPFKDTVCDIAQMMDDEELNADTSVPAAEIAGKNAEDRINKLLEEDKDNVNASRLSQEDKHELLEIIHGLSSAIKTREKGLIRILFYGYKNTFNARKKIKSNESKIESILKEYSLI